MINEKQARKYCCEDISKIENYAAAVADSKMWDIHHRAETDEVLTKKDIIAQDRYWNRPASELIFLTRSAHLKLHSDKGTRENVRKAAAVIGRKNGAANGRKYLSKTVLQFTKSGEFVREWPSTQEVESQLGLAHIHICDCCNGKQKSAYGFVWKYK